jgi:signal peptidase II
MSSSMRAERVEAPAEAGQSPPRILGYALALVILIADQLVKLWVIDGLRLYERRSVPVLPFANLTWVENRGVSMGMLDLGADGRWILVALTAAIGTGVAVWLWRERSRVDALALGLVLGGAIGNIIDRVRFGYVVDFIHLFWRDWHFYVFNVADAAITIGVALLLLRAFVARPGGEARHDLPETERKP